MLNKGEGPYVYEGVGTWVPAPTSSPHCGSAGDVGQKEHRQGCTSQCSGWECGDKEPKGWPEQLSRAAVVAHTNGNGGSERGLERGIILPRMLLSVHGTCPQTTPPPPFLGWLIGVDQQCQHRGQPGRGGPRLVGLMAPLVAFEGTWGPCRGHITLEDGRHAVAMDDAGHEHHHPLGLWC